VYVEICPFTLERKGMSSGYAATPKNKKAGGGDSCAEDEAEEEEDKMKEESWCRV